MNLTLTIPGIRHRPFAALESRARRARPAMQKCVGIMRKGEGSIDEQFRRRTTILYGGRTRKWKDRQPFGNSPRRGKGRYRAAWVGDGAGSTSRVTDTSASCGVDTSIFKQARKLQGTKTTSQRVTPRQRAYLHAGPLKVHLKASTRFLRTEPRAVRCNSPGILRRCGKVLVRYVAKGVV